MEKPFDFWGRKKRAELANKEETENALKEASWIVEKYKLPKKVEYDRFNEIIEELPSNKATADTKAILRVPTLIFPQIVSEKQPTYVYQYHLPGDDSGGYGPSLVWLTTENKLRILTQMSPGDNDFYNKILYPSYLAQIAEVSKVVGGKKVSLEELDKIEEEMGFMVNDSLVSWLQEPVSRIKLLSPKDAASYKNTLWAFHMKPEI